MTELGETQMRVIGLSKSFARSRSPLDWASGRPAARLMAVRDVSFDVAKGETLGIVGESGCGKSTLARCLVRLLDIEQGEIIFEGENALAHRGDARRSYNRSVQMVFQDPNGSLNPRMTVGECIGEALAVHAVVARALRITQPRHVLHFLYFAGEPDARSAAEALRALEVQAP